MREKIESVRRLGCRPEAPEITKRQVSPARQKVIEWGQRLNHGRIENLEIRDGEPVLEPPPAVFQSFKFDSEHGSRQELMLDDFVLKKTQVELLLLFDRLKNGVIQRLEFKGGLPFHVECRGALA